jgi:hypothetical protein
MLIPFDGLNRCQNLHFQGDQVLEPSAQADANVSQSSVLLRRQASCAKAALNCGLQKKCPQGREGAAGCGVG